MKLGYITKPRGGRVRHGSVPRLEAAGCSRVFREQEVTGLPTDRYRLWALIESMEAGDVLAVIQLDDLAISARDLLSILGRMKAKGILLQSLEEPWADMSGQDGVVVADVLFGLVEFQARQTKARVKEGRKGARARGTHMGRPPKLTEHQKKQAKGRLEAGELPSSIAADYNVSRSTILRL